jgi:hypothetical protein
MIQVRYPPQTSFFEFFTRKLAYVIQGANKMVGAVLLTLAKKVLLRASTPHFGKQGIVHHGTVW